MLQWLRKALGTAPEPEPTLTELMADMLALEAEWRSFLEQQTKVSRRLAKRDRDQAAQVEPTDHSPPTALDYRPDKGLIRQRAVAAGLFRRQRGISG